MVMAVAALICLGLLFLWLARRGRARSGLPPGQVTYSDTWRRSEHALFSRELGLAGRPDYLVDGDGGIVPVEVKSRPAPKRPYRSHVLQLAAYCLLVDKIHGDRPTHGIVKYDDHSFRVDYDRSLEEELLHTLERMRGSLTAGSAPRNHSASGRCAACGHRDHCDQVLI